MELFSPTGADKLKDMKTLVLGVANDVIDDVIKSGEYIFSSLPILILDHEFSDWRGCFEYFYWSLSHGVECTFPPRSEAIRVVCCHIWRTRAGSVEITRPRLRGGEGEFYFYIVCHKIIEIHGFNGNILGQVKMARLLSVKGSWSPRRHQDISNSGA